MKIKSGTVSDKAWGDVDKGALGNALADGYASGDVTKAQIREVYAFVPEDAFTKDSDGKPKFMASKAWGPHHEIIGGSIVLNRGGLGGAAGAVAGSRSEPSLAKADLATAKAHLRKHYKAIKEKPPEGLAEALAVRRVERGKPLEEIKGSLGYLMREIEDAFRKQFNPMGNCDCYCPFQFYILYGEIFADHVIVAGYGDGELAPDEFYLVTYQAINGKYIFALRDQWEIIELAYQPQGTLQESKGRKRGGKRFVETIPNAVTFVESEGEGESTEGPWKIAGTGITANVVNENGRYYPDHVVAMALQELKGHLHESAGQGRVPVVTGESDHPHDKGNRRPLLLETVVNWGNVSFDGSHVSLDGALLGTSKGRDIRAQMQGGVIPGISQRAWGESKMVKRDGRTVEEITELHITGYDFTAPSEQSDADAGVTMFESTKEEDEMDPEEIRKFIAANPQLFEGMIKGKIEEAIKTMGADQLKALEEKVRASLDVPEGGDWMKALSEANQAKKELAERKRGEAITAAITEATKELPYGELNAGFVEAVKAEAARFAQSDKPAEAVKSFVESKRKEYDSIVAKAKLQRMGFEGVKVLGPVLERETGTPEFARGSFEFTEALVRRGYTPRRDLRKPRNVNDEIARSVIERFDECYKGQLAHEAKLLEETGELSTDLSLPYSVSRAVLAAVFPELVATGIFDVGVTTVTPFRLYYETSAKESGTDGTATAEAATIATIDSATWVATTYKRLKPGTITVKQYQGTALGTVTMTEGTDYVMDHANGAICPLTGGSIIAGTVLINYGYLAIRKGENVAIERAKTTLAYKTLDAAADRLAAKITSEAVAYSRAQIGWDATTRTLQNLIMEMRRKIDKDIFYAALGASLRVASNSAGTYTKSGGTLSTLVEYIGGAKVKVANRFYQPTFTLMSVTNSDHLANWGAQSNQSGIWFDRADAELQPNGFVGRVKGLPVFQSTEMSDSYVLVGNRELVAHRVFMPMALKGPFPTYSSDQLVAADQWYAEEYNVTDVTIPEKGSHVKVV